MIGAKVMVMFSLLRYAGSGVLFPPVGAVGEIVSNIDEFDEYDVLFYEYPCNTIDPSWITHKSMIVFIGDNASKSKEEKKELCFN
jgi:hypothetical protein